MTEVSMREVKGGWRRGFHAETRQLWEEAGMLEKMGHWTGSGARHKSETAATTSGGNHSDQATLPMVETEVP
jgi:hypothetical protein